MTETDFVDQMVEFIGHHWFSYFAHDVVSSLIIFEKKRCLFYTLEALCVVWLQVLRIIEAVFAEGYWIFTWGTAYSCYISRVVQLRIHINGFCAATASIGRNLFHPEVKIECRRILSEHISHNQKFETLTLVGLNVAFKTQCNILHAARFKRVITVLVHTTGSHVFTGVCLFR